MLFGDVAVESAAASGQASHSNLAERSLLLPASAAQVETDCQWHRPTETCSTSAEETPHGLEVEQRESRQSVHVALADCRQPRCGWKRLRAALEAWAAAIKPALLEKAGRKESAVGVWVNFTPLRV